MCGAKLDEAALDARVVRNLPSRLALKDLATLDLPAACDIIDVVQALANEFVR